MYLASVVNLGMIWCFGFFFLELLDDFDEKSNNNDALASLDDADRNWAAIPTITIAALKLADCSACLSLGLVCLYSKRYVRYVVGFICVLK